MILSPFIFSTAVVDGKPFFLRGQVPKTTSPPIRPPTPIDFNGNQFMPNQDRSSSSEDEDRHDPVRWIGMMEIDTVGGGAHKVSPKHLSEWIPPQPLSLQRGHDKVEKAGDEVDKYNVMISESNKIKLLYSSEEDETDDTAQKDPD